MLTRHHVKQLALIINRMRPKDRLPLLAVSQWREGRNAALNELVPTKWVDTFNVICPEFDRTKGDRA